jgi:hypothetical protein
MPVIGIVIRTAAPANEKQQMLNIQCSMKRIADETASLEDCRDNLTCL